MTGDIMWGMSKAVNKYVFPSHLFLLFIPNIVMLYLFHLCVQLNIEIYVIDTKQKMYPIPMAKNG